MEQENKAPLFKVSGKITEEEFVRFNRFISIGLEAWNCIDLLEGNA